MPEVESKNEPSDSEDGAPATEEHETDAFKVFQLADSLYKRFEETGQLPDLERALSVFQVLYEHLPTQSPARPSCIGTLATILTSRFSLVGQLSDLEKAVGLYREVLALRPSHHPNRSSTLNNLAIAVKTRFDQTGQLLDLGEAIELHREALALQPVPHPHRSASLNNLANAVQTRSEQTGKLPDLEEAIALHREALTLFPVSHPTRPTSLNNLAIAVKRRFNHTGQLPDLAEAIVLHREALTLFPVSHPNRSASLNNLAGSVHTRFKQTGQLPDLEEAIGLHREALLLQPAPHPGRSVSLNNLANAVQTRFQQTGQLPDLEEAIGLHREALVLRPASHPDRSSSLNNLASALKTRFEQKGQLPDLEEAIVFHREALVLLPVSHPNRSAPLNNLANAVQTRFEQTGQLPDLEEAIGLHREALALQPLPHPDRSATLNNLANAVQIRFGQTGQLADLEDTIAHHREALVLFPVSHPNRSTSLSNLAAAVQTRFDHTGHLPDLEEAIVLHSEALTLRPAHHPDRSSSLNNLATAVRTRFEQKGQLPDIEEAIGFHREALTLFPVSHPNRSTSLDNLARAVQTRFRRTGQLPDLEEAIALYREALGLRPAPHSARSNSLNNLAGSVQTRFEHTAQLLDLDEAIALHREALLLQPVPHPDRSASLNNLASAVQTRFEETGQPLDLEEAIGLHREALALFPASHPNRITSLDNLGSAVRLRFQQTSQLPDLEEAIALHRAALLLRPPPHRDRLATLYNLTKGLREKFSQTRQLADLEDVVQLLSEALTLIPEEHPANCNIFTLQGVVLVEMISHTLESKYFDDAIAAFRTAAKCETARLLDRVKAAQYWANFAYGSHDSALEAYQYAIELLPRMATLDLDLQSRQRALISRSDGLARNAAACAIRSGDFGKAVEFLEAGRNIFWSQALQLRTPLDELHTAAPNLAKKLQDISRALEQGSFRDMSVDLSSTSQRMSVEKETIRYRILNEDWWATLAKVRLLDGFNDFLLPKALGTLQHAASKGPVIILNASIHGCDALIVTSSRVSHVPLPKMTFAAAKSLTAQVHFAVSPHGSKDLPPDAVQKALDQQMQHLYVASHSPWLSDQHSGIPDLPMTLKPNHVSQPVPPTLESQGRPWSHPKGHSTDYGDTFGHVLAVLWESVVEPVIRSLKLEKTEFPPRLWWYPTGPFTSLPLHAAGLYGDRGNDTVSEYVVSSYIPTLNVLLIPPPLVTPGFKTVVVIQQDATLPNTREELHKIEKYIQNGNLIRLGIENAPASVESVLSHLSDVCIAHFACHGTQNVSDPLDSGLILDGGNKLKISKLMEIPMPKASLAFLSACETAMGTENIPDEAMHIAASMLFAGFRGAAATLWAMEDEDGPEIADSFYRHLFQGDDKSGSYIPDTTQAAYALHLAVKKLRREGRSFQRWVPFIYLGL